MKKYQNDKFFPFVENRYTSWKTLLLLMVFSITAFGFLSASLVDYQSQFIYAQCPEVDVDGRVCGSIPIPPVYEKYSQEWWTQYCNQMINTKYECK